MNPTLKQNTRLMNRGRCWRPGPCVGSAALESPPHHQDQTGSGTGLHLDPDQTWTLDGHWTGGSRGQSRVSGRSRWRQTSGGGGGGHWGRAREWHDRMRLELLTARL